MEGNNKVQVNITSSQTEQTEIRAMLASSAVKDCYQDCMLVCGDSTVWGARVILALAYPNLATILKDRSEDKELVLILPDFTAEEIKNRVEEFLAEKVKEEIKEEATEEIHETEVIQEMQEQDPLGEWESIEEEGEEGLDWEIDSERKMETEDIQEFMNVEQPEPGGLTPLTLYKRQRAYDQFVTFFLEDTGEQIQHCLQTEKGRMKFDQTVCKYFLQLRVAGKDDSGDRMPKKPYVESIKSHIKSKLIEDFNTDITNPVLFPDHQMWWRAFIKQLIDSNMSEKKQHPEIDPKTILRIYKLLGQAVDALKSRGDPDYDAKLAIIPARYHNMLHAVLQWGAMMTLMMYEVRQEPGEKIDALVAKHFRTFDDNIFGFKYIRKVSSGSDNFSLGSILQSRGGVIPYLELDAGFNPGKFFEYYLSLLPQESHKRDNVIYLFPKPRPTSAKFDLHNPMERLYEISQKIGKNEIQKMLPCLCEATNSPRQSNSSVRATSIMYLRKMNFSWETIIKITGHRSTVKLVRNYDLKLETAGLVEIPASHRKSSVFSSRENVNQTPIKRIVSQEHSSTEDGESSTGAKLPQAETSSSVFSLFLNKTSPSSSIRPDHEAFLSVTELSRERYKKVWSDFKDFMLDFMGDVGALELRPPSEEEILNFVCHLRQKGMASSSLWTMYSIVNSIIKAKYSFSLKKYPSVTTALRSMDGDVKKKTKTFTKLEFDMFVENQTICSPYWLVRKVIVIVSYFGGLRHIECDALKIENFSVTNDGVVVTHSRPKKMRDEESRFFVPPRYGAYIQDYLHLVMMDLGKSEGRVWFTGRDTALVACSMGKNTISKVPFEMATLLELDEPEDYSFHSLRSINTSPTAEIGYRLN